MEEKLCVIAPRCTKTHRDLAPTWRNAVFFLTGYVFDLDHQVLRIRNHGDGMLTLNGKSIGPHLDVHEYIEEIPKGRFVYTYKQEDRQFAFHNTYLQHLCIVEDGIEEMLSVYCYAKRLKIDLSQISCCVFRDWTSLREAYEDLSKLPLFSDVWADMLERELETDFASHFPISRAFPYLLMESQMTNKQFAEYFGTNVRNVENWKSNPKSLAPYIYDLFEYRLFHDHII